MKKTVLALAAVAPLCAFAQSNVTLFGVVDMGVAHVKTGGNSVTAMTNSGASFSRWGIRGTEDLGGGLKAGFWLEAPLSGDVGQGANPLAGMNFIRRSTVSLMGSAGELRLGQDFAVSYHNPAWFDPLQGTGIGQSLAFMMLGAPIRIGNAASYFLPSSLGGFYGQAQYAFGEQPSGSGYSKKGNYMGARLGWDNRTLNIVGSIAQQRTGTVEAPVKLDIANVAASYNFGVVKPMVFWAREKNSTGAQIDAYQIGATAPIGGVGELRGAFGYYDRKNSGDDWTKISLGYLHNLSKRTALYGTVARVSNRGAAKQVVWTTGLANAPITQPLSATPGGNSTGVEFGIRHAF